ncbi:MAG: hypothetical protein PHY45_10250 [Rhodocyclaceae bacterium]|nr:hypothetical protein [Rhodocyclaceae bacterium]
MSQSLCARCLEPLPRRHRHPGKILCDPCETAWRRDFDRSLHHHLGKPAGSRAPAAASPADRHAIPLSD